MSESRNELLAWYNDLSQSNYSKIEQFGTGAGHCLIIDSIFRDVPLQKVKFQAKHEWEYVANFKVLQSAFDKHKIDNAIPVERLIKCKFQDNLEFMQWIKKFWDQYYPGGTYDPKIRIQSQASNQTPVKKSASNTKLTSKKNAGMNSPSSTAANHLEKNVGSAKIKMTSGKNAAAAAGPVHGRDVMDEYQKIATDLNLQVSELKLTVDQVEKEREFYFGKLREIEVYIQSRVEGGIDTHLDTAFKNIQEIMYKTEDGFEAPEPTSIDV